MSSALNYLSVSSGIEAASVAWHPLGWNAVGYSEIEPFPCAVLHEHYSSGRPRHMPSPDEAGLTPKEKRRRSAAVKAVASLPVRTNGAPNFGDMNSFKDWPDADVDVLVGGTPCQSFSVAGLRKGLADPRGNLALVYLAIADKYRPEWLLWENVPGVLSVDGGRAFGAIIGGMVELGYNPCWRVLDAQYVRVDGFGRAIPQRRRRVFVVGNSASWRRAAAVLFEPESLSGNPAPRRQTGQDVAGDLGASSERSGGRVGRREAAANQLIGFSANTTTVNACDDLAPTMDVSDRGHGAGLSVAQLTHVSLCLNGGGMGRIDAETETLLPVRRQGGVFDDVAHALKADGFDASEDGTGRGTPLIPIDLRQASRGGVMTNNRAKGSGGAPGHGIGDIGDPAFTVSERGQAIAFDTTQITSKTNRCQPQPGDACHPLAAGAHAPAIAQPVADTLTSHWERSKGAKAGNQVGLINPIIEQRSGWAVRRLMPVECERLQAFPDGYTAVPFRGKPAADGPRYKALGNSMACNVMRWIGFRIDLVNALVREASA